MQKTSKEKLLNQANFSRDKFIQNRKEGKDQQLIHKIIHDLKYHWKCEKTQESTTELRGQPFQGCKEWTRQHYIEDKNNYLYHKGFTKEVPCSLSVEK